MAPPARLGLIVYAGTGIENGFEGYPYNGVYLWL
jgi:hypothetical protein